MSETRCEVCGKFCNDEREARECAILDREWQIEMHLQDADKDVMLEETEEEEQ